MILKRLHTSGKEQKDLINWRGHEVTRIEAFSDAIFAFSITLLIVSLEVPKTFEELMVNMRGFLPFSVSFALFFQIWVTQNLFFRRYGMHDETTLMLNAVLLFVVLFFVYPMKFLWSSVFSGKNFLSTEHEQARQLIYIYSGGFAAIYFLFSLMYLHAYRRREHLHLTESEQFETKTYIYQNLFITGVGLSSVAFAAIGGQFAKWATMTYILIAGIGMLNSKRKKIHEKRFGAITEKTAMPVNETTGEKIETE